MIFYWRMISVDQYVHVPRSEHVKFVLANKGAEVKTHNSQATGTGTGDTQWTCPTWGTPLYAQVFYVEP